MTESAPPPANRCPGCGAAFVCGMQAGLERCWCVDLPPVVPSAAQAACLCPQCLAALASRQAGAATPGQPGEMP